MLDIENASNQDATTFHRSQYVAGNLMFSVGPSFLVGGEVLYGWHEAKAGETGNATRVQFSVQYDFIKR